MRLSEEIARETLLVSIRREEAAIRLNRSGNPLRLPGKPRTKVQEAKHTIEASLYERAGALVLNKQWMGLTEGEEISHGDIGDHGRGWIEGRGTKLPYGGLCVQLPPGVRGKSGDPPDHWYLLVTGEYPDFWVYNALPGWFCQQPKFWREDMPHHACYLVPQWLVREKGVFLGGLTECQAVKLGLSL
jgi:hypothetical protein